MTFQIRFFILSALAINSVTAGVNASERPTMNITRDPRPDILAHPFYYAHTEYRREYNRPRNLTGWLAYKIAPSSQEAMVWEENYRAGRYDKKHTPPVYKRYYAPKPWEVLQIGARPDVRKQDATATPQASPSGYSQSPSVVTEARMLRPIVHIETQETAAVK